MARWRLASMGGSRHPLSVRGRATKQICGHHDGCHADPMATATPQGCQTNPWPPNRIIMQNHRLATYLALVPIFFIFKTTNIWSDTSSYFCIFKTSYQTRTKHVKNMFWNVFSFSKTENCILWRPHFLKSVWITIVWKVIFGIWNRKEFSNFF